MINMILWVENPQTMIDVMESVDEDGTRIYPYPYSPIAEMKDAWLLVLNDKDDFDALEQALEAEGDLIIIGTYNVDGSQYQWFEQGQANRNHSFAKYKEQLKDVIDYDENGEPIGSHPPTDEEAENTQVNKVFGWGDRVIEDIEVVNP